MTTVSVDTVSQRYREKALDLGGRKLLMTRLAGSEQEPDLSEPVNCGGYGRIRHFRRETSLGWPPNPLPIDPACRNLGLPPTNLLRAQVFQNSICNWRCWYCFVDFADLSGNPKRGKWLSADEMLSLYINQPNPPIVLDLTGGQPDLTPEWVPWMMDALEKESLAERVFLWSDDNLSNDYFWRFLSSPTRQRIAAYQRYGRVCCFKGFDQASFAFNTQADASLFDRQFELMGRLLELGLDLYGYVTLTTTNAEDLGGKIRCFMDRLQNLDPNLPLRTVPLEIRIFAPVEKRRPTDLHRKAIELQWRAVEAWQAEIETRYTAEMRGLNIADIPLRGRR